MEEVPSAGVLQGVQLQHFMSLLAPLLRHILYYLDSEQRVGLHGNTECKGRLSSMTQGCHDVTAAYQLACGIMTNYNDLPMQDLQASWLSSRFSVSVQLLHS